MGRRREKDSTRSQTLPPSPSHSFSSSTSSSDFEFTISISPRKSSSALCPADELFYKGQLLPLHLSPRISMVRTLLASSSTSSSSDTTTTASRDSTGSSSNESNSSFTSDLVLLAECDSSRPSSVTEDDEFRRLNGHFSTQIKKNKYFSLSRFSSVFKKETKNINVVSGNSSMKKMSSTAKDVIRKYMKKVKPLYEKLSQKQQQKMATTTTSTTMKTERSVRGVTEVTSSFSTGNKTSISSRNNNNKDHSSSNGAFSHSFSGNLRYPRRKGCISSCPSSMRSSPSHSGVLSRNSGFSNNGRSYSSDTSSMEELQSAIQGAIAHCKNSMNKSLVVSNEI